MLQKQTHRLTVFSWTYWGILPFLLEESLCYFLKYQFIFLLLFHSYKTIAHTKSHGTVNFTNLPLLVKKIIILQTIHTFIWSYIWLKSHSILRFFIRSCQIYSFHISVCKYGKFQFTLYLGPFLPPVPIIITASAQIDQADALCSFALTNNCPDSAGCLPEILPSPSLQMHFMDPSVHYFPLTNQPVFPSPSK